MLQIDLRREVYKFLRALPHKQERQIVERITLLAVEPKEQDTKQLHGYVELMRVDVGEYRIVYTFDKKVLSVLVVGKRNDSEVYKKLRRKLR